MVAATNSVVAEEGVVLTQQEKDAIVSVADIIVAQARAEVVAAVGPFVTS
jgi:hypothetical protein